MPEMPQSATLKQIQAAWDKAQAELVDLRGQVEYLAMLAQAKTQKAVLDRDVDRAFRDLGEAVWAQVSKGKLQLPSALQPVMKALESVTNRIQEQNASINDLLAEGAELASKLKGRLATTKTPLAPGGKKR